MKASRSCVALIALLVTAMIVASCSGSDQLVDEHTSDSANAAVSDTAAPAEPAAIPTPARETDEDQIRTTILGFQDAFNTGDWDSYYSLMCTAMRDQFTPAAKEMNEQTRADHGLTQAFGITVTSIDGDKATADYEGQNAILGHQVVTLDLAREDGQWKVCMHV